MSSQVGKTTLALYRDCLRLVDHMAGRSAKAAKVRAIVRSEFLKNKDEADPTKIETLRNTAMQGLANYLTVESLSRLKKRAPVVEEEPSVPEASIVSETEKK